MDFLKPLLPFIRIGYKNYAQGRNAYNVATSYLLKRCIAETVDGDVFIDVQRVMLSIGFLDGMEQNVVARDGDKLNFTWLDNSGKGNAEVDDKVLIAVYNTIKKRSVYQMNVAKRADGVASIKLPEDWNDDVLMTFVSLCTADESEVSNSIGCLVNKE